MKQQTVATVHTNIHTQVKLTNGLICKGCIACNPHKNITTYLSRKGLFAILKANKRVRDG